MDWQLVRANLEIALIWAFTHGSLFAVSLSGAVASYLPVSYTHLDVYKRQLTHSVWLRSDH